jgi:guanosine-3',5'-bis(diphosphate) 3'-pyrophosphohydrolase
VFEISSSSTQEGGATASASEAEAERPIPSIKAPREQAKARGGVRSVLSRLRPSGAVPTEIAGIVRLVRQHHPKADWRPLVRAFELAQAVHEGQLRKSGELFIEHPVGVARILAEQGMDPTTIVAAFLHDSVEDTDLRLEDLRVEFGEDVAVIIDGLTKIENIGFRSAQQEKAENLRKMIVSMAKDLRVLIIKLADRLHNMRTLEPLEPSRRELLAVETLEIYAPLAHRLGMQQIRSELEDLAFDALHPKRFAEIEQMVAQRQPEREEYLRDVVSKVQSRLREVRVKAEVSGRPKHFYSIYEKMVRRGREFDEIFDLVGVRILVDGERDCWAALGAVHSLWKPIPGRFKDYIATPKFNLYQSLHTTVMGPGGKALEIQIRTKKMHRVAEWGIAAHWKYKEGVARKDEQKSAWMRRMLELQQTEDDSEFLETLRVDLFADEVFVFTPKGDVVELPKGATPIDFAYAIHTDVGHSCVGARVDGRLVPLDYRLASGQTVEILTSKTSSGPSRDWLKLVSTPRARTRIRQWFTKERRQEAISEARESIARAIRRTGLSPRKLASARSLDTVATALRFPNREAMYLAIGEGRIPVQTVVSRLIQLHAPPTEEEEEEREPLPARVRRKPATSHGVLVKGADDLLVKLARCCMPVPGDPIIGFVTKGSGVSVHREGCTNSKDLVADRERLVEVLWDPNASGIFPVSVQVEALDRPKLLRDITTTISDFGVNITSASAGSDDGIATLRFTFEVADPEQLRKIKAAVRKIEAVYDVYRVGSART